MSGPAAGLASLAVRDLVTGPRRRARLAGAYPAAIYLELSEPGPEPRMLALVAPAAAWLPVAVVTAPWRPAGRTEGGEAFIGGGVIEVDSALVQVRRWWDPSPVLAPVSRPVLERGCAELRAICAASPRRPGLGEHAGPPALAARCAAADLTGAAQAARRLVGLGPGLTPSGDDVLAGLLLALRLLGGAACGGTRAVGLADQLAATVTGCARGATTPVSVTLLHCAASGQASAEAASVLHAMAGQEPAGSAARRLLSTGHTSGADLALGLVAGGEAVLALSAG